MAAYSQLHDKEQYCTLNTVCQQRSENCCEKFYSIKDLAQWLDKLDGIVYAWYTGGLRFRAPYGVKKCCSLTLSGAGVWRLNLGGGGGGEKTPPPL